jgi:hypothetical protein
MPNLYHGIWKMIFRVVILSVILLSAMVVSPVAADTVTVDLEYRTDTLTWELYALINDTGSGNSGDNGLAALRALIDNIDFGTNGEAVNIPTGIGAIDPIDPGGPNERPPVLQTSGGTLDIIYGQNISVPESGVGGVGVSRTLIIDGTFPSAETPPAFGDDDRGFTTDGNFLDVPAPGPFGGALPWDMAFLDVLDVTPGGTAGDYNGNGILDAADYTIWQEALGGTTLLNDPTPGVVDRSDYIYWQTHFGTTSDSGTSASTNIPEPSSLLLTALALGGLLLWKHDKSEL